MYPDQAAPCTGAGLGAVVLAVMISLSGCATLENGFSEDIAVVTVPAGASVASSSGTICTSPCAVSGARKDDIGITISKTGFVTQSVTAASKPSATLAAAQTPQWTPDALGRFIDIQNGAHFKHDPAAFVIKLDPEP